MSALPLFWPEGDVATGLSPGEDHRPPIMQELARNYQLKPLDFLSGETLSRVKLLMLAQPRALRPAEFVALDEWVAKGGKLLVFADPALDWPSRYPIGDPRRAPPASMLGPLFSHWGLVLGSSSQAGSPPENGVVGANMALVQSAGRWTSDGGKCRVMASLVEARCWIGSGQAILIADADLLSGSGDEAGDADHKAVSALLDSLATEAGKKSLTD